MKKTVIAIVIAVVVVALGAGLSRLSGVAPLGIVHAAVRIGHADVSCR